MLPVTCVLVHCSNNLLPAHRDTNTQQHIAPQRNMKSLCHSDSICDVIKI